MFIARACKMERSSLGAKYSAPKGAKKVFFGEVAINISRLTALRKYPFARCHQIKSNASSFTPPPGWAMRS
jgi:hypothetical protein